MPAESMDQLPDHVFESGNHTLIRSPGTAYNTAFYSLMEKLSSMADTRVVIVTTLWSANALSRRAPISKFQKGSLHIIDTISLSLGSHLPSGDEFVFLSPPVALESLMLELERAFRTKGRRNEFLVIDSLPTLDERYPDKALSQFFTYVMNRMLERGIGVIAFDHSTEAMGGTGDLVASLMEHVVHIGNGGGSQ